MNTQPVFYVPSEKKEQKIWSRQMLDYISGASINGVMKPRRILYQKYYDLMNGVFNMNDYKYVWATFGDVKPMTFANYPLLYPIIQSVVGKFQQQPLPFTAYKVNPNAANERLNMEAELLFLQLVKPYWEKFQQRTGMTLELDERMQILPPDIKKYMKYDYRDLRAQTAHDMIQYTITKHNTQAEFAKMLYDIIVTGDCFGKVEYVDGDAVVRRIDPRTAIPDRPVDMTASPFEVLNNNMDYFFEETYMTHSEVLYEYEYYMSDNDKKTIKDNIQYYFQNKNAKNWNNSYCNYYIAEQEGVRIRVLRGQWKARNTRDFPKEFNEATGEAETQSLDIFDVWEGVKIGHDIYVKLQRKKNIMRTGDNWRQAQLDYFGVTTKYSVYDKAFNLQMLYNIVMSHIEFAINQSGGKATTIYVDDIPIGEDGKPKYELDDIIYMAKVQGVILKQRKEGAPPTGYPDNYQQVDFGLSATINNLILFKTMIEQTASRMTGVSPDSLGFTKPYQAVGVTESNLVQSNSVIFPMYYAHSKVIECSLQKMADLGKIIWSKNDTRSFVMGDMGMKIIQLSTDMDLDDIGIFMLNNAKDQMDKDFFMQLGTQAMATDATLWMELVKMYNSSSAIEAQKILEQGIESIREMQAQKQQQGAEEAQGNQQLIAAALQQKQEATQLVSDTAIKGKQIMAEALVTGKEIDKESSLETQELKNKGTIHQQQLKDSNASLFEKENPKPQPKKP